MINSVTFNSDEEDRSLDNSGLSKSIIDEHSDKYGRYLNALIKDLEWYLLGHNLSRFGKISDIKIQKIFDECFNDFENMRLLIENLNYRMKIRFIKEILFNIDQLKLNLDTVLDYILPIINKKNINEKKFLVPFLSIDFLISKDENKINNLFRNTDTIKEIIKSLSYGYRNNYIYIVLNNIFLDRLYFVDKDREELFKFILSSAKSGYKSNMDPISIKVYLDKLLEIYKKEDLKDKIDELNAVMEPLFNRS